MKARRKTPEKKRHANRTKKNYMLGKNFPNLTSPSALTFLGVRHAFLPDKPLRKSTWQAKFKRDFRKLVVTRAGRLWNESGRKESFSWFVSELTYPSYSYKKRLLLLVVKLSFYIFINNINSRQITDFHYYWKLFKIVSELVSTGSLGVQCQLETLPSFC